MSDSAIFEVIVGMIFIYSLLSILVTQINAIVSNVLRLRAQHLRDGISDIVTDPAIRARILTHPLIRMVQHRMIPNDQAIDEDQAEKVARSKVSDVSWIPPETFVNVLMNIVRVSSDREIFGVLSNIVEGMPASNEQRRLRVLLNKITTTGQGLEELRTVASDMSEPIYRNALLDALQQIDDALGNMGIQPNTILSLNAGVRNIKNPHFRTAMETIMATSRTIEDAETKLKAWFNEGMDRATNAFSKHMQRYSVMAGLLIAVCLNVDSLNIARTLWEDPAVRATVSAVVQQVDIADLEAQARPPVSDDDEASAQGLFELSMVAGQSAQVATQTVNTLLNLRVPVGWRFEDLSGREAEATYRFALNDSTNLWNFMPANNPNWLGLLFGKVIGWATTTIAVAQGAPFWFNILRRLTGR